MTATEPDIISTFVTMAGFALATSASPGPVNIVSAMSGAKFGASRTIPYALGATIGFVSILAMTGSGLSPIITCYPRIEQAMAIFGSIYMLYLAYKLAGACLNDMEKLNDQSPPSLIAGIFAQYTNPKAWIVSISAISIYVSTSADYETTLAVFCAIFFVICFPSLLTWSIIGSSLSRKTGSVKTFNLSMAFLLVVSILTFIVELFL